ncbi:response regulator transcription factor [Planomicrobium okeanokoites]|uniref:response regulator transcription factor n=1 Tax=Planomicrobium okeanokoites TaxID=244 RepID=UPI00249309F4|nr:response regulator transcription factor [Planomicrobium okeanokoites]
MIRVLVVDDHILIRKGLVLLLESYSDISIIGEASDGEEAIRQALKEEPDVILMDISMPNGIDGMVATQEILKYSKDIKVILLSMHDEEGYIQEAIEIEADGYILKNSQGGELHHAIQQVHKGEKYYKVGLPPEQIKKLFENRGKKQASILTLREQEVLRLVVYGYTNRQVSEKLSISPKTVENHKANIMTKLELKQKSELIQYAIANHYIDPQ